MAGLFLVDGRSETKLSSIVLLLVTISPHVLVSGLGGVQALDVVGEELLESLLLASSVDAHEALGHQVLADVEVARVEQSDKVHGTRLVLDVVGELSRVTGLANHASERV